MKFNMEKISVFCPEEYPSSNYEVYVLDRNIAERYVIKITQLLDQIPLVDYTQEEVLAEGKGERIFHGKWEHSLIVFDGNEAIAVLIAYEREAEKNDLYPYNLLYIGEIAVDPNYSKRGLAKFLLNIFFVRSIDTGFKHLEGELIFGVQTNLAEFNHYVQKLYESFGLNKTGEKVYDNRMDNVYRARVEEIILMKN